MQKPTKTDKVSVGSTVRATAGKREITYMIVGSEEANPAAGKVSNESPLGKAFLGKKVGEHVEVKAPAGNVVYTVVEIKCPPSVGTVKVAPRFSRRFPFRGTLPREQSNLLARPAAALLPAEKVFSPDRAEPSKLFRQVPLDE